VAFFPSRLVDAGMGRQQQPALHNYKCKCNCNRVCNLARSPGSAFPLRRSARVQQQWASRARSALVSRWPPGVQEGLVCRLTIQGGDAIGLEAACESRPSHSRLAGPTQRMNSRSGHAAS